MLESRLATWLHSHGWVDTRVGRLLRLDPAFDDAVGEVASPQSGGVPQGVRARGGRARFGSFDVDEATIVVSEIAEMEVVEIDAESVLD